MRCSLWVGIVLAAGCGSRAPAPAPPPPPVVAPTPVVEPRPDAGAPVDPATPEQVALSDDPCAGGEVDGSGGSGLVGTGVGGGGRGEGIGLGTIGTRGAGGGSGQGYGAGAGGPRGDQATVPTVTPGEQTVTGDIDKSVIRRVVRQNLPRLRYCYEKQLAKEPKLAGKTVVKFVIDQNGDVPSATASGLHPEVDRCIEVAFKRMKFPKPNAGVVQIVYPLVFKTDDSDAPGK